jgi:geranylgeranyl pyrophosphate synthase
MQSITDIIEIYKPKIYRNILKYINLEKSDEISINYKAIKNFHTDLCADYPKRGGKYLRSVLVMLMAEALGGSVDTAVQTASAIEVSQNWLLIHDDIMDGSLKRRGQPTLNRKYNDGFAVNAGDCSTDYYVENITRQ